MRLLVTNRGANQLLPGNQLLRQLDKDFQGALPENTEIINIYSLADPVVSAEYSRFSYGKNFTASSMYHSDILAIRSATDYARLLNEIYAD